MTVLRPLTAADATAVMRIYSGATTPFVREHDMTREEASAFLESVATWRAQNPPVQYMFGIDIAGDLVGTIGLRITDDREGRIGYVLREDTWGHGYATAALRELVAFAFTEAGLEHLGAKHHANNPASGRVLAKAGFRHTARDGDFHHYEMRPGMPSYTHYRTPAEYWDSFKPNAGTDTGGKPNADRINWTQYPGHGPGAEILGTPTTALELGGATAVAAAALARTGVQVTSIDYSPTQIARARQWWADEPNLTLIHADLTDYLTHETRQYDAIFSNWGAAFFTDPDLLLPLVLPRLNPGGVFAFSSVEPLEGHHGAQVIYGNGYRGPKLAIPRWMLTTHQWTQTLQRHGFTNTNVDILPGPEPGFVGTTLGRAYAP